MEYPPMFEVLPEMHGSYGSQKKYLPKNVHLYRKRTAVLLLMRGK